MTGKSDRDGKRRPPSPRSPRRSEAAAPPGESAAEPGAIRAAPGRHPPRAREAAGSGVADPHLPRPSPARPGGGGYDIDDAHEATATRHPPRARERRQAQKQSPPPSATSAIPRAPGSGGPGITASLALPDAVPARSPARTAHPCGSRGPSQMSAIRHDPLRAARPASPRRARPSVHGPPAESGVPFGRLRCDPPGARPARPLLPAAAATWPARSLARTARPLRRAPRSTPSSAILRAHGAPGVAVTKARHTDRDPPRARRTPVCGDERSTGSPRSSARTARPRRPVFPLVGFGTTLPVRTACQSATKMSHLVSTENVPLRSGTDRGEGGWIEWSSRRGTGTVHDPSRARPAHRDGRTDQPLPARSLVRRARPGRRR